MEGSMHERVAIDDGNGGTGRGIGHEGHPLLSLLFSVYPIVRTEPRDTTA